MMKKTMLGMISAVVMLSLAACAPTAETQTGAALYSVEEPSVEETEIAAKTADPDAPKLDVISIYMVNEDGKLDGTIEAVETTEPQALVDMLITYGVMNEGTEVLGFETEGDVVVSGPGAALSQGDAVAKEKGILNLNQVAEDAQKELKLTAVANTFIENMNVQYLEIQVNGETIAENVSFVDVGK